MLISNNNLSYNFFKLIIRFVQTIRLNSKYYLLDSEHKEFINRLSMVTMIDFQHLSDERIIDREVCNHVFPRLENTLMQVFMHHKNIKLPITNKP